MTSTTSTVSYRKEKVSTESSDSSTSKVKKKTSHSLSDFLTGSPLKTADKDKDKVKEKKEKKHGKFHISSPLKAHKSKSGESPKSGSKSSASSDNGVDEVSVCGLQHTETMGCTLEFDFVFLAPRSERKVWKRWHPFVRERKCLEGSHLGITDCSTGP